MRLEVLSTRADDVWLYVRRRNATSWVMVGLSDGSLHACAAQRKEEDRVLRALEALAPEATVGFSAELDLKFRAAPKRRNATADSAFA